MTTPSRAQLRAGLVVDVEVGAALTLHPAQETRTIVVRVLGKSGRHTRLRVQSHEAVRVSAGDGEKLPAAG